MERYEWTTPKGAKVEVEISQEHVENDTFEGMEISRTVKQVRVESFKMNGIAYDGKLVEMYKQIRFRLNGKEAAVVIPPEIYDAMMAETRERVKKSLEAERKYNESVREIYRTMNGGH